MSRYGGGYGIIAGLPCFCCMPITTAIGGLYGLMIDMRYISGILVRCMDYFIGPMFY
ncbi:MAG: hypothetical protein MOIL_01519 [Candidatus Methanolliviera sp. GoM_oil]|nr:MAG: hypothetical protein MOIL_01519 [Candidatus Methanolliviera sp. GoM_oil]